MKGEICSKLLLSRDQSIDPVIKGLSAAAPEKHIVRNDQTVMYFIPEVDCKKAT